MLDTWRGGAGMRRACEMAHERMHPQGATASTEYWVNAACDTSLAASCMPVTRGGIRAGWWLCSCNLGVGPGQQGSTPAAGSLLGAHAAWGKNSRAVTALSSHVPQEVLFMHWLHMLCCELTQVVGYSVLACLCVQCSIACLSLHCRVLEIVRDRSAQASVSFVQLEVCRQTLKSFRKQRKGDKACHAAIKQ